jgi:hypothetical protein
MRLWGVRVRAQDCFELGVILLRKKLYTQATKNLEKAVRIWDGAPEELAQVRAHACMRACLPPILSFTPRRSSGCMRGTARSRS